MPWDDLEKDSDKTLLKTHCKSLATKENLLLKLEP